MPSVIATVNKDYTVSIKLENVVDPIIQLKVIYNIYDEGDNLVTHY